MSVVLVSGGFDPIHSGHINYIQGAAKYGEVWVLLNSDEWLLKKKKYRFMEWKERAAILMGVKGVTRVMSVDDEDGTVCKGIMQARDLAIVSFANGGDRGPSNTPEAELCERLGIEMIFNCGGGKTNSSSELINAVRS